jgi:hypothetical protein
VELDTLAGDGESVNSTAVLWAAAFDSGPSAHFPRRTFILMKVHYTAVKVRRKKTHS